MALQQETENYVIGFTDYYFSKKKKSIGYVDRTPKMG